ncbi:hypothetical protein NP493_1389g00006 [Ridgeia piscesae]|uniref:Uncharacterized protein n=1 Tax=Ridgeia piscesae TaxID=27915 RepID=A0AAD9K560_RIDPI|nr:hypothetical protein NP493_1389g00006 [Ridgeia piscesae]
MAGGLAGMMFLPYYKHIMTVLETNKELKRTVKGISHQMAYAAGGAAIGGIVAGPPGALVGSIVGSVAGYMTVDSYNSMVKVLREMSDSDKKRLVKGVQELVGSSSLEALTAFLGQQVNRELFMHFVKEFSSQVNAGG